VCACNRCLITLRTHWRLCRRSPPHRLAWQISDKIGHRGGDIDKWVDSNISHVLGVDISANEIESAKTRLAIIRQRRPEARADIQFRVEPGVHCVRRVCVRARAVCVSV
jgi:hypothetical protein